jgi:hypothetical protein
LVPFDDKHYVCSVTGHVYYASLHTLKSIAKIISRHISAYIPIEGKEYKQKIKKSSKMLWHRPFRTELNHIWVDKQDDKLGFKEATSEITACLYNKLG